MEYLRMFANIYPINHPNVGNYTIPGAFGFVWECRVFSETHSSGIPGNPAAFFEGTRYWPKFRCDDRGRLARFELNGGILNGTIGFSSIFHKPWSWLLKGAQFIWLVKGLWFSTPTYLGWLGGGNLTFRTFCCRVETCCDHLLWDFPSTWKWPPTHESG
jgi:hypothetical protein